MERLQDVSSTQPTELQFMLNDGLPMPDKAAYTTAQSERSLANTQHLKRLQRSTITLFWDLILIITPLVFIGERQLLR